MRRLLCLFSLLCWLLCVPAMAETPSVRIIDRIADPAAEPDFSFDGDAPLLEMIFPQVLNADAMLLRCGGEAILVDCASAKQASRVTDMLSQLGVDHLDAIINTHPHYDHLQGLENVAGAVAVDALWVSFPADYNQHMVTAMEVAQRLELPVVTYGDEDTYTLGGADYVKSDITDDKLVNSLHRYGHMESVLWGRHRPAHRGYDAENAKAPAGSHSRPGAAGGHPEISPPWAEQAQR